MRPDENGRLDIGTNLRFIVMLVELLILYCLAEFQSFWQWQQTPNLSKNLGTSTRLVYGLETLGFHLHRVSIYVYLQHNYLLQPELAIFN